MENSSDSIRTTIQGSIGRAIAATGAWRAEVGGVTDADDPDMQQLIATRDDDLTV